MKKLLLPLVAATLAACAPTAKTPVATAPAATSAPPAAPTPPDYRARAEQFLSGYNAEYVRLSTAASEAEWRSNTRIVAGDTANAGATTRAWRPSRAVPTTSASCASCWLTKPT